MLEMVSKFFLVLTSGFLLADILALVMITIYLPMRERALDYDILNMATASSYICRSMRSNITIFVMSLLVLSYELVKYPIWLLIVGIIASFPIGFYLGKYIGIFQVFLASIIKIDKTASGYHCEKELQPKFSNIIIQEFAIATLMLQIFCVTSFTAFDLACCILMIMVWGLRTYLMLKDFGA